MTTNPCRTCGTEIPPTGKRGRPAVFCSDTCRPAKTPGVTSATAYVPTTGQTVTATCKVCCKSFERIRKVGKPHTKCEACRGTVAPMPVAIAPVTDFLLITDDPERVTMFPDVVTSLYSPIAVSDIRKGAMVKITDEPGTFKVMEDGLHKDGSVMLYGGRGGYQCFRAVMPSKILLTSLAEV